MNIKIILAAHKPCEVPADGVYLPLFVGAAGKENIAGKRSGAIEVFARDDMGENISAKNPAFCELTGLYWAWKNLDADAIGLVHYRRIFGLGSHHEPMKRAMTGAEYEKAFIDADILVPAKRHYYITTLYRHYSDTHDEEHLVKAKETILQRCPEYGEAFDRALGRTWGYMFNMMVARRDVLDEYCSWLFPLLFDMEENVDTDGLSSYNQRLFGRISELLFNVWLYHRTGDSVIPGERLRIAEIPWYSTVKVPWGKKATAFLNSRLSGKKYEGSF